MGVKPTKSTLFYYPRFPAYIVDIDIRNAESIIAIDETTPPTSDHRNSGQIEKKYVSRWTKARIHQHDFREHVLSAYQISCAVCDLPHAQLLEASPTPGKQESLKSAMVWRYADSTTPPTIAISSASTPTAASMWQQEQSLSRLLTCKPVC